jgi:hypothetical protein
VSWPRNPDRRTLRALDAGAQPPRRMTFLFRPTAPAKEKATVEKITTRPPRPQHLDPALRAEAAKQVGMAVHEVIAVRDIDAGRIITTKDGSSVIVVPPDRPDAWGQTGTLVYETPGHPAPRGCAIGIYADPNVQPPVMQPEGEGWTVADLDVAAAREFIPAPTATRDPWGQFLTDDDPATVAIRARALWIAVARRAGITPEMALRRFPETGRFRQLVVDSGLLGDTEAKSL